MTTIYWFYKQRYITDYSRKYGRLFLKINKNIKMNELGSSYTNYAQRYYIGVYVPE